MNPQAPMIIADTHVHWHRCFDPDRFCDAALAHFDRFGPEAKPGSRLALLCLTDVAGVDSEAHLCDAVKDTGRWSFARHADGASVCAVNRAGRRFYLLPGRQIVSVEDLEILALNCRMTVGDRAYRLEELLDQVLQAGGTPVVPWGFGKWSGRRGAVVGELLGKRRDFFLGDNGNRLRGTAEPVLLREGRERGLPVLAGSDPLPFAAQAARAGSYGILGTGSFDEGAPASTFRDLLQAPAQWRFYGELTGLVGFLSSQVKMQLKKRLRIES